MCINRKPITMEKYQHHHKDSGDIYIIYMCQFLNTIKVLFCFLNSLFNQGDGNCIDLGVIQCVIYDCLFNVFKNLNCKLSIVHIINSSTGVCYWCIEMCMLSGKQHLGKSTRIVVLISIKIC